MNKPLDLEVIVFNCPRRSPPVRLMTVPCITLRIAATVAETQTERPGLIALLYNGRELWGWYRDGREQLHRCPAEKLVRAGLPRTQLTLPLPLSLPSAPVATVLERTRALERAAVETPATLCLE